ncbi:HAD domain-containing protein [Massilia soli]|uniref:FCP1 homology domain-containing protein n=1 Tax=Massilia soli TaxID=2792854 RepID=A0ABS7SJ83_9BURK|nr:HAD domain-containing protein [Massilia soli]MBZ2206260.1 hypothetical protein [Massilia soli]
MQQGCESKTPRGGGGLKVCYLDFDGVLHDDSVYWNSKIGIHIRQPGRTLFEWMPVLEKLLLPYPDVRIVLSTSWVRVKSFEFAKRELSPALQARVVGATYHNREIQKFDFDNMSRGAQVLADVHRRDPASWFAIDNDGLGWPDAHKDKLVLTDDRTGISDRTVQENIRKMLERFR